MRTAKSDLTGMYAQSIGIEAARELIAKKIKGSISVEEDELLQERIARSSDNESLINSFFDPPYQIDKLEKYT